MSISALTNWQPPVGVLHNYARRCRTGGLINHRQDHCDRRKRQDITLIIFEGNGCARAYLVDVLFIDGDIGPKNAIIDDCE